MCEEMGVRFLGKLPLDPALMKCCEEGKSYLAGMHSHEDENELKLAIAQETTGQTALRRVMLDLKAILDQGVPEGQ